MRFNNDDVNAMLKRFAHIYSEGKHTVPSPCSVTSMKECVEYWFSRIPVKVRWTPDVPYQTWDEMKDDIDRDTFRVTCDGFVSAIFGSHYQRFRAVHDYFGHYLGKRCFGIIGELGCYGIHTAQFPPECWPMIFNELILANSFKDVFGHYSPDDKLVMVPHFNVGSSAAVEG